MAGAVPVLMYHSIAREADLAPHGWLQRLATSPELMEATFDRWRKSGWHTIGLEQLADWLDGRGTIPRKALVLTLDDGYLDNWVGLQPLLEAYRFRAVVFVSTDFIDPRPVRRKWAVRQAPDVEWKGYLSADEIRAMEAAGTVEFGSHARTHTWWYTSDRVVDWYRPQVQMTQRESLLRFLWLNSRPDRKPFALSEMDPRSVPWGTPIYEFAPALVARRFVPDPREADAMTEYVACRGGAGFFERADWRSALEGELGRWRSSSPTRGDRETDQEYRGRVRDELATSREILSQHLGRDVRMLSCPQGAMDAEVERIAEDVGYRRWTMSYWRFRRLNRPGVSARHIYRCGRGYELFGLDRPVPALTLSQAIVLNRYSGSWSARVATGALTLGARLLDRANGHPDHEF